MEGVLHILTKLVNDTWVDIVYGVILSDEYGTFRNGGRRWVLLANVEFRDFT
jgi:hypothetical protein